MVKLGSRSVIVLFMFLMVASVSAINGITDPLVRDAEPAPAYQDGFRWDFQGWERDTDGDGVDDLIPLVANQGLDALPRQADGFLPFSVHAAPEGPLLDLYVAYEIGVGATDLALLAELGLSNVVADEVMPAAFVPAATPQQATAIAQLPGVVMVEVQQLFRALNNVARQATQVEDSSTYADDVWNDLGYTGTGVGIAVLDVGVDDDHQFLQGRFVAGADAANVCGTARALEYNPDDANVLSVGLIGVGINTFHGTHVAGTALGHGGAGGNNAGMAKGADLYDVKVLTDIGISCLNSVSLGMNFVYNFNNGATTVWQNPLSPLVVPASKQIDIVSLSLGGACSDGLDSLSQGLDWLVSTGVVAVVATGNDAVQPPSGSGCITSPSAAKNAISVGAYHDMNTVTRADDAIASFSNCGPSVASPNSDQKKPDVTAPGVNILSSQGAITYNGEGALGAQSLSGTSMATPVVAGIAALMLEKDPTLTPSDVKDHLRSTADFVGSGPGYTIGSDYQTCWGFGQVNAYEAVSAV